MKPGKQFGNLPGPRTFWTSEDGRTRIIRHCHGVFTLEHDGREVMPQGTFERICRYVWAEFIDWL